MRNELAPPLIVHDATGVYVRIPFTPELAAELAAAPELAAEIAADAARTFEQWSEIRRAIGAMLERCRQ